MSGLILGDWTHRRGDAGGSRAVSARILNPKPRIAWRYDLPFDGRIEQVRVVGEVVTIAATPTIAHSGWQHAEVVTLNAESGRVMSQRRLPDPVPPSTMIASVTQLRIIATRAEEPAFLYALTPGSLLPVSRSQLEESDCASLDIVDAWGEGRELWCHLDTQRRNTRLFVNAANAKQVRVSLPIASGLVREPCCADGALFVPLSPVSGSSDAVHPCVRVLGKTVTPIGEPLEFRQKTMAAVLAADGAIHVVIADPVSEGGRTLAVSLRVFDRQSLLQRGVTRTAELFAPGAERLRLVRRPSGELLAQLLDAQMAARSDLFLADDEGAERLQLGNKPYVADLALGDQLVAHRELDQGRALVVGFELDRRVRILGRRASLRWSFETPPVGSPVALYAGAGHLFVRGARTLIALDL